MYRIVPEKFASGDYFRIDWRLEDAVRYWNCLLYTVLDYKNLFDLMGN